MFNGFIQWRNQYEIDTIFTYEFPELQQVKTFYPHGFHQTDNKGQPVYIERIGLMNVKKLFELTTKERMLKYQIREIERLVKYKFPACSKEKGHFVQKQLIIFDLKDAPLSQMTSIYDFLKTTSETTQNYYPEMLYKMYIINTPFIFRGLWSAFKSMLGERTVNKINIHGEDFLKHLITDIDENKIPTFLGGKCNCPGGCLEEQPGPWNQIQLENLERMQRQSLQEISSPHEKEIPIQKLTIPSSSEAKYGNETNENLIKNPNDPSKLDQAVEDLIQFIYLNRNSTGSNEN